MSEFVLNIDLSKRSSRLEEISDDLVRKSIGGRGLGAYLLHRSTPPKADPLGEANRLILTAGPVSGTGMFYSSKSNLTTKSPLTGVYLHSVSSGILSAQMRKAGLWALDIHGASDSPVYLSIRNERVAFEDAGDLWGQETAAVQKAMLDRSAAPKAATLAIGPAGEHLNPMAAVFGEGPLYRCFGRGGAGAVLGAKKLKGICVQGDGRVVPANETEFDAVKRDIAEQIQTTFKHWAGLWRRYETGFDLETLDALGILPTRNWQTGKFDGWAGIDKSTTPLGWPEKGRACGPFCLTPGCREVVVAEGPYQGARSDIEWETIYAFGASCGVDKMDAVIAAGQICDEYGIDTMSAGITIGFAMECFEKGLIDGRDTDGLDLRFGDDRAMIEALKKIVRREGFGNRLAGGVKRLSAEIAGSGDFAMQVKGLELGGYECRGLNGQALAFATASRGGCHHSSGLPARRETVDHSNLDVVGRGEYVKNTAINQVMKDSLIVCSFCPAFTDPVIARVLSACWGEPWAVADFRRAAERVIALERLFNMREGLTRADDALPGRLLSEPKPDGPHAGAVVPLEALKDSYYRAMRYDPADGNPTEELLADLGLAG